MNLDTLSWLIVLGNFSSIMLTGPIPILAVGEERAPRWQQLGFAILFVAQGLLMWIGWELALSGFARGPLFMIAGAVANWLLWRYLRRRRAATLERSAVARR
jgi:hypothetical protein